MMFSLQMIFSLLHCTTDCKIELEHTTTHHLLGQVEMNCEGTTLHAKPSREKVITKQHWSQSQVVPNLLRIHHNTATKVSVMESVDELHCTWAAPQKHHVDPRNLAG